MLPAFTLLEGLQSPGICGRKEVERFSSGASCRRGKGMSQQVRHGWPRKFALEVAHALNDRSRDHAIRYRDRVIVPRPHPRFRPSYVSAKKPTRQRYQRSIAWPRDPVPVMTACTTSPQRALEEARPCELALLSRFLKGSSHKTGGICSLDDNLSFVMLIAYVYDKAKAPGKST